MIKKIAILLFDVDVNITPLNPDFFSINKSFVLGKNKSAKKM